ncbi:MAG: PolC-type DNA polymerase III [Clostridiales bacterium]|nr:PolC-type DNA polymerase III [Clostridiales bacterium]
MTYDELLRKIGEELPETRGNLTIERVLFNKTENKAIFSFLSDTLVGEKGFLALKSILARTFPAISSTVRVASPSLAQAFLEQPEQYALPLNQFLLRNFPATVAWEFDLHWTSENGRVILEVPDEFALRFLEKQSVRQRLSQAVKDVFRLETDISFRVSSDEEKRLHEMEAERAREEKLAREQMERARTLQQSAAKDEKPKTEKPKTDRIRGRAIADKPVPICDITDESGVVTLRGRVLAAEQKSISGGEAVLLSFDVTDYTSTIRCKVFLYYRGQRLTGAEKENPPPITDAEKAAVDQILAQVKPGVGLLVRGEAQFDKFSHETVVMARDITKVELPERTDDAPEKRIELHLHTQMSNMDAVTSAEKLIARAAKWGHEAIAVTDHGVVQAFPEAFAAAKKNKIKLIPGVEGYLTDDDKAATGEGDLPLDAPIIVLDFETTGLNTQKDRVIEIGAVKLYHGQVVDSFSMLVNPGMVLPAKITEITHISDQMLRDAPPAAVAIPKLMAFMGDCPIAAHNAQFDCSMLASELKRLGETHQVLQIDTLTLARKLYPELKSHRLGSVCKHLHVSLKGAHRAVNDAAATAQCLARMLEDAEKRGAKTVKDLNQVSKDYTLGNSYHIIILAATQKGMENINHMVSESHLRYFRRRPHIPRAVLQKYRAGCIVGSACESGELYRAIVDGASDEKLLKMARFYDYLEIQPVGNNQFLIREGRVADENVLRDFNRKIVWLGEKLGLPVVATGDVHFMDPEDAVFRAILQAGQGFDDCDNQPPLYFKTTQEMLDEFSYLGEKKAHQVVIDNPRLIASRVSDITLFPPHPEGKTTFSPFWPTAEEDIKNLTYGTAHRYYGDELPDIVQKRIDKELNAIVGYGYCTLYSIAQKLVAKSLKDGYVVGSRGSVGSSFVAFLTGITEINALPPHYRCLKCRKADFNIPKQYTIGVDLPDKLCPDCGEPLVKDGFDIPFEAFLGFKGDKVPDIDLNFSGEYQPTAHAYVKELFGPEFVFRAGTIGTLAEKTAYGYVLKYLEERGRVVSEAEKNRLAQGCVGVKRTTGQHPAGMVVLPKAYDINQFTAVQHPADDVNSETVTTHYDFNSMHDILVKLDILGHDDPTMLHMLEELTGVNFRSIPLDDKQVMSLFSSPKALGVTSEEIGCNTGTFGVPEMGTAFVRQMLEDTHPTTMQELIRISGLSHGTDVWLGNAKDLIDQGIVPLSQCLCTREDIMNQLMQMGVPAKMAFDTMEFVRKGKGLKPEMVEAMHEHNVPAWFEESCRKIKYMFPKGHAAAYVTMALRVAWYKVYRPQAYYAAYFTIRGDGFDACTMILPKEQLHQKLQEAYEADEQKKTTAKDKDAITAMELVQEMMARGYYFLPADLYKSDVRRFLPEGERGLRVPFLSLGGLGETAAESIGQAREIPFLSVEDLKNRAKLSNAVIDLLREHGCLKDLPETSQVTLF